MLRIGRVGMAIERWGWCKLLRGLGYKSFGGFVTDFWNGEKAILAFRGDQNCQM